WLDGELDAPAPDMAALHVILDEICSNIVKHSGASMFEVAIEPLADRPGVKLTFADDGTAYDPLSHLDPDTTLSAAERPIGGLGIMMVKKMADAVVYAREQGRNRLCVSKSFRR
ncbi:MAG: ATP-binding protein, partial [Kiritimatiellae bacterium]|nr:ATP-binding protein [Kiritimatiellia bacterium]